jgi:autotransporter-associated beta strand protein
VSNKSVLACGCVAAILAVWPAPARAATYSWGASYGDWSVPSNWSGGTSVPTSGDTAYIINGGTASVTTAGETCGTLALGNTDGIYSYVGTVEVAAGSLTAATEDLGVVGRGVVTQSGGTNTVSSLILENGASGGGTYNLNGGRLTVSALSESGTASWAGFNLNGGTLQAGANLSTTVPMALATSGGIATLDTAGYAMSLAGQLSGPGGITKAGSGTLTLGTSNTFSGATLISGGTLALGNSGALQYSTLDTSGGGTVSFGSLGAATLGGLSGPGALSLNNTAGAGVRLSVGNNNSSTTYSGTLTGSGGLTKVGTGTLTLAGSNTYAGLTEVSGGTLVLANSGALQQSCLSAGAAGILSFGSLSAATFGGLAGNGILVLTNAASRPVALTVGANGGNAYFTGWLLGSGSLVKVGTGMLDLGGPLNSYGYTGGTTITAGTLTLENPPALQESTLDTSGGGTLSFSLAAATFGGLSGPGPLCLNNTAGGAVALSVGNNSSSTTYSGALSGPGGLAKVGSGVLTLTASSTYSGGTSIWGGTLLLDFSAPGAPPGNIINYSGNLSALTLGGGALAIQNATAGIAATQRFNGLTLAQDASTIRLNQNGGAASPNLSLGGISATTAGGALLLDTSLGGTITTTTNKDATGIYGGRIVYYDGSDYDWATTGSSASPYTLSRASTTAPLPPGGSSSTTNYLLAGSVSGVTASETANTLKIVATGAGNSLAISPGQLLTLGAGGLLFTGSSDYAISGGSITAGNGSGAYELIVQQYAANNDLTIASAIANNGTNATSLAKAGPGTLTLSAASNSYSGGTSVLAGTLALTGNMGGSTVLVGGSGTAALAQSGGTNTISRALYVGKNAGGNGTYNLSGGALSCPSAYIGYSGTGNFAQSGGTTAVASALVLGALTGASGTYNLSGGWLSLGSAYVGSPGAGDFAQSGGTTVLAGSLYVGNGGGGTYSLSGGSLGLSPAATLIVGDPFFTGTFILSGAGILSTPNLNVSTFGAGAPGAGTFTQSGGTNTVSGQLALGSSSGVAASYSLSGGFLSAHSESVASGGFAQSGGTNTVSGGLSIAGPGAYTLTGGSLGLGSAAGGLYVGYGSNGTFTQSGGTSAIAGALYLGNSQAAGFGAYNLNGGMLIVSAIPNAGWSGVMDFSGGTLQAGATFSTAVPITLPTSGGIATFDTNGYTLTLTAPLSGPGSLAKVNSGTLILAASNTYTGATVVNGGLLSIIGSLNNGGPLAVGGGTLSYAPTASGGTGNTQAVAGLTVNAGASGINAAGGNTLALGPIARNTGGTVGFNTSTTGTISTTQANTNGILGPWATYGSGSSMMYAAANGASAPYTIAAYSGAAPVASGTAGLADTTGAVNYTLSGGGGALSAAVSANTLQFTGAANTITATGANPLSLNGIMNIGSGTATIAGGNLIVGSARELVITGPGNVTIGAAIQDNASGASALTMAGGGTLLLSGANTYGGDTIVSGGTLQLGNAAALPQGTNSGNLCLFGTLDLNNLSVNVNGLSGSGVVISNSPGNPTLTVGNNNATSAFSGAIQNGAAAVALAKTGTGTLSLTGSSTYTGPTLINAGSLIVNGWLGDTALSVGSGASLGGTGSIGGSVTVAGGSGPSTWGTISLVDGAPGTLTLSDAISTDTVLTLGGSAAGSLSLLDFEVGASADRILVTAGKLVVNPGGGIINITPLAGFGPGTYDLMDFLSGQASGLGNLTLGTPTLPGYTLQLQSTPTAEQLVVQAVPEPGTLALLAAGLACGAVVWLRRKGR